MDLCDAEFVDDGFVELGIQADLLIRITRFNGEWFVAPLPPLPADLKTLPLRLRVEDYRPAKNNQQIVYVGPIRLLELDRP